jgi:4-diphosphocytidyl-2-C-methyl-D-erythritol kinase
VPFLHGGTALGIDRGTELYPLPEPPKLRGLLMIPPVEISTAEAYAALGRTLTGGLQFTNMERFQALSILGEICPRPCGMPAENDFEGMVSRYPRVVTARRRSVAPGRVEFC